MTQEETLEYYDLNAENFISGSIAVDLSDLRSRFLIYLSDHGDGSLPSHGAGAFPSSLPSYGEGYLPVRGTILDLGCGSGRDSKVFLEHGYDVTPVDGSEKMCELTSLYLRRPVIHATFQSFRTETKFDGIWASASLLHVRREELPLILKKYAGYLKKTGCFYVSFKYGTFTGDRTGRYYSDQNEETFRELMTQVPELMIKEEVITADAMPGREGQLWLNAFLGVSSV